MTQRSAVLAAGTACAHVSPGRPPNALDAVTFKHRQLSEVSLRSSLETTPPGVRMAGVSYHSSQASRVESVARKSQSQSPRPSLGIRSRGCLGIHHRLRQDSRRAFQRNACSTRSLRVLRTRSHSATCPDGPVEGAAEAAGTEASQEPGAAGGASVPGTGVPGVPAEGATQKKAGPSEAPTATTGAPARSTAGASPAKGPGSAGSQNDGAWAWFSRLLPDVRALGFVLLHLAALVLASKVLGMDSMFRSMVQQLPSVRFVPSTTAVAPGASASSSGGSRDAAASGAAAAAGARVGTVTGRRGRRQARTGLGSKPITVIKDETGRRPCHVASSLVVPFSEFLHHVKKDNIQAVSVDGDKVTFVVRRVDGGAIQPQHRAASLLPEVLNLQEVIRADERLLRELDVRARPDTGGGLFSGQLAKGGGGGGKKAQPKGPFQLQLQLVTVKPPDLQLPYSELVAKNVEFGAPEKVPYKFVNNISFALLYAGILASIISRLSVSVRGPNRVGGKQKKGKGGRGPGVLFADVAGVDEAKEELEEIVEYLRKPERFTRLGARPPRGVLLVGPPGTGKTMLAKAVAGEADVPFVSCSGSEFVELYVGLGASRVRELFAQAKKEAPSIVFIDEIDSVAKVRDGRARSVGNDEREQTLNQLLTEMDGFDSNTAVIVLAATNRADVIDPALRRPGRFDRIVAVEPPDRKGRVAILNVHIEKQQLPLADNVDVSRIATATTGFTGADLANIVNEAALLAAREESCDAVARIHFDKAVERAIAGIEKKRSALGASEKAVVARHEAGHAILGAAVAKILVGHSIVQKISIVPRSGGALGFAYIPPAPEGEERQLFFADELRGQLATLLGGRAAEEVAFNGRVSTGAMDDIRRATDLAYKGLAEYGLSSVMGPLSISTLSGAGGDGGGFFGFPDQGRLAEQVQQEVQSLLQEALSVAREVVHRNVNLLHGLGTQLEEDESVEGEVLKGWLDQVDCTEELQQFLQRAALLPLERTTLALPSPSEHQSEGERAQ